MLYMCLHCALHIWRIIKYLFIYLSSTTTLALLHVLRFYYALAVSAAIRVILTIISNRSGIAVQWNGVLDFVGLLNLHQSHYTIYFRMNSHEYSAYFLKFSESLATCENLLLRIDFFQMSTSTFFLLRKFQKICKCLGSQFRRIYMHGSRGGGGRGSGSPPLKMTKIQGLLAMLVRIP